MARAFSIGPLDAVPGARFGTFVLCQVASVLTPWVRMCVQSCIPQMNQHTTGACYAFLLSQQRNARR